MQPEIHTLSDEELLNWIQAGKPNWRDLLSVLLQRHHGSLVARCHAYLHNRQDAEDAAQETELRAFRAIQNFRKDASFRTWLLAIAVRQCHDLTRKRAKHVLDEHLRAIIEIHEQKSISIPESSDNRNRINEIMTRFPKRERDVLMLRFYVDLSLQDMASYLGLSLSATKMRLYRALELFSVFLQSDKSTQLALPLCTSLPDRKP